MRISVNFLSIIISQKRALMQHQQALTPTVSRLYFQQRDNVVVTAHRDKRIQYWFRSRQLDFRTRDGSCSISCASQPTEGSGFSLRWRWRLFGSKSKKHYRVSTFEWVRAEDLWVCIFYPRGTLFLGINKKNNNNNGKLPQPHMSLYCKTMILLEITKLAVFFLCQTGNLQYLFFSLEVKCVFTFWSTLTQVKDFPGSFRWHPTVCTEEYFLVRQLCGTSISELRLFVVVFCHLLERLSQYSDVPVFICLCVCVCLGVL